MAAASLQVEPRGSVLLLTIDRPQVRNALDPTTLDALSGAIAAGTADPIIRAIVLAGAGGACFSAGMDLRAVQSGEPGIAASIARFHDWMRSAERPPIVAAVQGLAVGGGFELMLMCDLAVVADDARFGLPEVSRGLVPGGGATLLPARIPLSAALEIGMTGEFFDADRALQLGLVNRVVPASTVLDRAIELAVQLAAQPRATLARIRHLMTLTATEGPAASHEAARRLGSNEHLRAEAAEGVARFLAARQSKAT